MIAGVCRISGSAMFASQLRTLVVFTPSCSAASFCNIFAAKRFLRMWSPTVFGSVGIRTTLPGLYDCGNASGIGWSGWLKRYVTVLFDIMERRATP